MLDREYEIMHRFENSHWWFVAKKNYIKTILDLHLKDKGNNILDVGCGTGGITEVLRDYGRVFGLDRHGAACELFSQRNQFPLIKGDANRLPFKKGTFHLIEFLKSTHDKAVMARHRYTLKELTGKLKGHQFLIERSTYLYFVIFPLVALSRLLRRLTPFFFKPDIRSDIKETNDHLNQFLVSLLSWEGKLLRRINFPFGSSLLILGKKSDLCPI
jgi:SAM-dependent methyltransferase